MFLFQFVKHIIETVIAIYEILLIWWVDTQYSWSHGIGSPIWGSSMTRFNIGVLACSGGLKVVSGDFQKSM